MMIEHVSNIWINSMGRETTLKGNNLQVSHYSKERKIALNEKQWFSYIPKFKGMKKRQLFAFASIPQFKRKGDNSEWDTIVCK